MFGVKQKRKNFILLRELKGIIYSCNHPSSEIYLKGILFAFS